MPAATIAVTGVSGLLGQRLLPLLDASDDVARVIGIDVRDPVRRARKLEFRRGDVSTGRLEPLLDGADVLVHLAAIVGPVTDESLAARVNVDGLRRALDAATKVGVRTVVRPSSAAVYGAWPNNPLPLTEEAPLRPNPGYGPALHDAECERVLARWRADTPGAAVAVLRVAPVVGPGATTVFANAAGGRPPMVVRGASRPVQVTHLDDAASAIAFAATQRLDGEYNVAADGWLTHDDAVALMPGRRFPALPYEAAERALGALWMSGLGEAPPTVLPYLVHPWVVANDRLRAAGWTPRHTNEEAILLAAPADGGRGTLPWVAAVGAVLVGAAGATWWLARRRSH